MINKEKVRVLAKCLATHGLSQSTEEMTTRTGLTDSEVDSHYSAAERVLFKAATKPAERPVDAALLVEIDSWVDYFWEQ